MASPQLTREIARLKTPPARKAKHTPEPWREFRDATSHDIMTSGGWHIARVEPQKSVDEQDANARLLAAAPELLEALARVRGHLMNFFDASECKNNAIMRDAGRAIDRADAAIAKAEGREP